MSSRHPQRLSRTIAASNMFSKLVFSAVVASVLSFSPSFDAGVSKQKCTPGLFPVLGFHAPTYECPPPRRSTYMSSLSVPAAPECTIVFDSEGGYCLEDTLSRRPDPLTLADALTCIATDECEVPERFADLLEANQNAKGTWVTMVDAEGQFSGSL